MQRKQTPGCPSGARLRRAFSRMPGVAHGSCCAAPERTHKQEKTVRAGCPPGTQPDDTRIGTDVDRRAAA
ncbi:hypothetical protein CFB45_35795 [Burkholderia sp. HI2500]|nr:hypothetical protein CFB45_35795 [Burkholderia sp. HI2500]